MSGCGARVTPEASYREAQALFRAGNFQASLAKARRGLQRWPAGTWGWQFRLLAVEDLARISRAPEARSLLESAGTPSPPALLARWKVDQANLAPGSDREAILRQALPIATASNDPAAIALVELFLSEYVGGLGEAVAHTERALSAARQAHDDFLLTWAQLARGYNSLRFSRFDEALPYLDEAAATARRCGARSLLAAIEGNQGWCYLRLGNIDVGMKALAEAESLSASLGQPDLRLRWLGDMGVALLSEGEFDRAEVLERESARLAAEVGNDEWLSKAWHNLAVIAIQKNDFTAARAYSEKELALHRRAGDTALLASSELTAAEIEQASHHYSEAEAAYLAVIAKASKVAATDVLWEAQSDLASLYAERQQRAKAAVQFRAAIDTIDRQWNQLGSDDSRTTFLTRHLIGLFQDYVNFLIETGHMEQALEIAESARARMLSRGLERLGAVPASLDVNGLQRSARASRTVVLSYSISPGRASVWLIGAGPLARFNLPPGREIDALVKKYTGTVVHGGDPLARNDAAASALYQAVLGPVAPLIPPDANVIVVPDGSLHQLSFETLVVPGARPHYWIEDAAVAVAPALRILRPSGTSSRAPRLLLFGDPVLTTQEFGPLPRVKDEIATVLDRFPSGSRKVLVGAQAVPGEYVKARPAEFTNIHFATHATANLESPLNSAIILSHQGDNFKLYASDVAAVRLNADLVTISACTSAGAKAYSGEGLMGFAWAFLQSGAQNVIATLWDEDDASSVDLMRGLYAGIAAGQSPARALRDAKLALLRSGKSYRLPYFWGPMQVFTRRFDARAGAPLHKK